MGLKLIETELFQYTTDLLQLGYRNSGYDMEPATIEKVLTLLRDFEQRIKTSGADLSTIASSRDGSVYKQFNSELCSKLLGACSINEFNQLMSSEYKMIDWMQLIQGAHSNTQDAVEILNDILNYDKVWGKVMHYPLTSIRMRYVFTPDRQWHSVSGAVFDRFTVVGGECG